jgi:hypothetical protein
MARLGNYPYYLSFSSVNVPELKLKPSAKTCGYSEENEVLGERAFECRDDEVDFAATTVISVTTRKRDHHLLLFPRSGAKWI